MADIFVSFTSKDSQWAQWLALDLKAAGHEPHVHSWEVGAGDDIAKWMSDRLSAADHVLCVMSPDYLEAAYSQLEHNAALWKAVREKSSILLYVVVRPCAMPDLTAHRKRCDLTSHGDDEAAARAAFRAFLAKPEVPASVPFPGRPVAAAPPPTPISNISIRIPAFFIGRGEAMAETEAAMARFQGRVAITALKGMRGVGKTVLAAAFADKHREKYRATWWVRAEQQATLTEDLASLGVRLGLAGEWESQDAALKHTLAGLRDHGDGVLLIFDNALDADSLRPFLPPGGAAQVLITTNAHA